MRVAKQGVNSHPCHVLGAGFATSSAQDKQYWLKTFIRILQHTMVFLGSIKSNWVRTGWILYRYSWKRMYCLKRSLKQTKYEEKLLVSSSPRIKNYTSALSLVLLTWSSLELFYIGNLLGWRTNLLIENFCMIRLLEK